MNITAKRATSAGVAPFGSVVKAPAGSPASEGAGYRFWSDIAHYRIEGETEIGLCTVFDRPGTAIDTVERHMKTPEILIPIDAPFVVPLMIDGNESSGPEAFSVDPGEAIVISGGVWHGACLPVGKRESSYFVIFRRGTPGEDVQKKTVTPFTIEPQ
jgi:ureidoglycolate hydrolase